MKQFEELIGLGLQPIILHSGKKIPIANNWNNDWNVNTQRKILSQQQNPNIGILLGDIVDVEGDSEQANNKILKLIGDYKHPCYRSQKSLHHLFLTPDPSLTIIKHRNIEFRGKGHQSVVPPSEINGIEYEWINFSFPIPVMPGRLLAYFKRLLKPQKTIKPGHMMACCYSCEAKVFIHKSRWKLELFAFRELNQAWQCRDCRSFDINARCRQIKKELKFTTYETWQEWMLCKS